MIECEYTGIMPDGREFSVYYEGGYSWAAWLEGTGIIASAFSAEGCIERVGKIITLPELEYIRFGGYDPLPILP